MPLGARELVPAGRCREQVGPALHGGPAITGAGYGPTQSRLRPRQPDQPYLAERAGQTQAGTEPGEGDDPGRPPLAAASFQSMPPPLASLTARGEGRGGPEGRLVVIAPQGPINADDDAS